MAICDLACARALRHQLLVLVHASMQQRRSRETGSKFLYRDAFSGILI